jgi:DNA polymerase-3 subunit epsilon
MLITDGTFVGTKAEGAAVHGTRIVDPDTYATLIQHIQPALARPAPRPLPTATDGHNRHKADTPTSAKTIDPATVRAWARSHGYEVGVRGRVSKELIDAYAEAHP